MRRPRLLTVVPVLCVVLLCIVACLPVETDVMGEEDIIHPEDIVIPSDDQLSVRVTADMPTAVLSSFAENTTGSALVKRLNAPATAVGPDTRMVLIKGSDMGIATEETIGQITDVLLRNGLLAIETPTGRDLLTFIARLIATQTARQQEYINENYEFGPDENPAADVQASLNARYNARINTMQAVATKAGISSLEEVMAEMIIVSNNEYFYQEPGAGEIHIGSTTTDSEGNAGESVMEHILVERTPYQCGLLADDVAAWLNDLDRKRAETKAATRSLATKAGANSLNELMDASETFILSGPIYHRYWDHKIGWRQNSVVNTFRSWGVHNMSTHKDYYYIQQGTLIKMGPSGNYKIYYPCLETEWYTASGYGEYDRWYGSFFSRYITSMNLKGNGSIHLEEAMPYTDNSTGYKTVNVGSEQSATQTLGVTWGATAGFMEASVSVGGEYSLGTTQGTYFEVSSTHVDNDISVVKNTVDNKVTWTYAGAVPFFRAVDAGDRIKYTHTLAPKALTSDVNFDNQIIWSVSNPSGQYTLEVTSDPYAGAVMYIYGNRNKYSSMQSRIEETHTWEKNTFSHTLLDPFRATQVWRMYVTIDEMADGGPAGSVAGAIENRLRTKFSCFRDEFTLCDRTASSVQVITANVKAAKETFTNNYDILQQFAEEQGVKQYTIHWRCNSKDIRLREGFTVKTY